MESLFSVKKKESNFVTGASNAFGKAAGFLASLVSSKSMIVLTVSLIVAFILVLIAMWIWRKLTDRYVNTKSHSMKASREGVILNKVTDCKDVASLPNMRANGQRATYTFWIYIHNLNSDGSYRYVFRRGASAEDVSAGASVLAFLDKDAPNKLHFRITKGDTVQRSAGATPTPQNPSLIAPRVLYKHVKGATTRELYTIEDQINGFSGDLFDKPVGGVLVRNVSKEPQGITVPYLPIQRWVHVAIVVNEKVNGGTITAYVDAEQVAQVKNAGTNFMLNTTNGVYIGDNTQGVEGLLSYLTFHNFDLNAENIYREYRAGPIRSLLAKFGMPAYGVRSPIYPLTADGNAKQ